MDHLLHNREPHIKSHNAIWIVKGYNYRGIYHKKGCMEELILEPRNASILKVSLIEKINECIKRASNYKTVEKSYYKVNATIKSYNRLLRYEGEHFTIEPTTDERNTSIRFNVSAFNESQAVEEFKQKLQILINLLSVETKSIYTYRLNGKNKILELGNSEEIYFKSPIDLTNEETSEHIIEGIVFNKISKEFEKYLDILLDPHFTMTENHELYFRSCAHYHTAKKT